MYSVNSVSLVSSFQHLIQQGFNQQQENQPRPIRKMTSPNQYLNYSNDFISENDYSSSFSCNQLIIEKRQSKLRSESLSIDFNEYKRAMNTTKHTVCSFCKNNGEPEHVYMSHPFKDVKGTVVCPILKNYKCPMCGESGEKAHTITYCKEYKNVKRNKILNNIN